MNIDRRRHDDLDRICDGCNSASSREVNGEVIKGPFGWKAKWVVNCPALGVVDSKECGRCRNRIKDIAYMNDINEDLSMEQIDRWHDVKKFYAKEQDVPTHKAILPDFAINILRNEYEHRRKTKIEDVELHIKGEDYLGYYQYWEEKL